MSAREIMLAQFARGATRPRAAARCPATTASRSATSCLVSSPVATQILHATGIAWAAKVRKQDLVAITVHWARARSQPGRRPRGAELRRHPQAAGDLRGREQRLRDQRADVDGAAVEDIAIRGAGLQHARRHRRRRGRARLLRGGPQEAIDRARSGEGPTLIEAKVTRLTAHSSDDQQTKYRTAEDLEAERPATRCRIFRDPAARRGRARRGDRGAHHRRDRASRRGRHRLRRGASRTRIRRRPSAGSTPRAAGADGRPLWQRHAVHRRWRPVTPGEG